MFIYYIKIKINSKCKPKLFYSIIFSPNQLNLKFISVRIRSITF